MIHPARTASHTQVSDLPFIPFHTLSLLIILILCISGEISHEPKEHTGSFQLDILVKNKSDLKFGALEDPVVSDNLAVEADVARWMRKS